MTTAAPGYIEYQDGSDKNKHGHSTLPGEDTSASSEEYDIGYSSDMNGTTSNVTVATYIPADFRSRDSNAPVLYHFSKNKRKKGPGFTLITMFNLFTGQDVEGYDQETIDSLMQRNWEYLTTVRENMNHPQIKKIILLYTDINSMKVLLRQNWENNTKVYPMKIDRLIHMSDSFNISSRYLIDEPVIATNGDILIGENFEQIDTERMRDSRTLYSLTRHGNKGYGTCNANSMCLKKYYGSHDTHIYRLKVPVSDYALKIMDYPVNLQQAENGMIGTMTMVDKFKVYNPCSILTTYHIHCSRIAKRLQAKDNSIKFPPWNVKIMRMAAPIKTLKYAAPIL